MKLLLHFAALSAVLAIACSIVIKQPKPHTPRPPATTTTTNAPPPTTTTTTTSTTTTTTPLCCGENKYIYINGSRLVDREYGQFPEDNAIAIPDGIANKPYLGFGPIHPPIRVTSFCFESQCAKKFFIVFYDENFNVLHSNMHEIAHKEDLSKTCFEKFYSEGCIPNVKYIRVFIRPHIVSLDPAREEFYPSAKRECLEVVLRDLEPVGCDGEVIW